MQPREIVKIPKMSNRRYLALPVAMMALGAALLPAASAAIFGVGSDTFDMSFVEIGNPGNTADTTGYGRVDTIFYMSSTEVSRDMIDTYNAVSGGPTISMYDYAGNGVTGGNLAGRPATGISWNESARFVNWLNVSSGSVAAYQFSNTAISANIVLWESGDTGYDADNPYRNSGANFYLPSENEWYKTAYFDGDALSYNTFATSGTPSAVTGGTDPDTAVYGNAFSVGPALVDEAGGASPYGTFGMNGNALEWMESSVDGLNGAASDPRSVRGGSWTTASVLALASTVSTNNNPGTENANLGFRVASTTGIPEPSGVLLVLLGTALLTLRRRRGA